MRGSTEITIERQHRENEVMGAAQRTEAAATASTQQTCQPDIHTVLREMSALMAEQRVELRYTKTQMEAMETRQKASENKAETVETRLRASEKTVEEQRVDLRQTEARLTASERLVERLQSENEGTKFLIMFPNVSFCMPQGYHMFFVLFHSYLFLSLTVFLSVCFVQLRQ